MERAPVDALRAAVRGRPRGIVIDAGSQVGLFSAAALSAGHFTISIDVMPEHVQMNVVSRAINNLTGPERGFVVHGALSDGCGRWATLPHRLQEEGNPGATHVVGRVSDGYPIFPTRDGFRLASTAPVLNLDHVLDHALRNLPEGVERRVYALKIDIEGYEPRALLGATRMLSEFRPDVILMELFVERFKDCDARKLIAAIAELGYKIDVYDRLLWNGRRNLGCKGDRGDACKGLVRGSDKLNGFLRRLHGRAEMDLVLTINNNTRAG